MNLFLRRIVGATSISLVLGATLAACSADGDTDGGTASDAAAQQQVSAEHGVADTEFAQMMIVHHQGALEMAELASEKATTPDVKELAGRISAAQQPEIDLMTGWLEAWGEESDPTAGMDHGGMDHAGMAMNGMTQDEVMGHLRTLAGAEFDASFLEHMIAHHEGAVTMADAEIEDGANPDAVALAEAIVQDQTAEIAEMEQLAVAVGK